MGRKVQAWERRVGATRWLKPGGRAEATTPPQAERPMARQHIARRPDHGDGACVSSSAGFAQSETTGSPSGVRPFLAARTLS